MRLDNGTSDRQSQTGALRLGGKERVKDLIGVFSGQPYAGIADRDQDLTVFPTLRLDAELTGRIPHRLNPIEHEIHQCLL